MRLPPKRGASVQRLRNFLRPLVCSLGLTAACAAGLLYALPNVYEVPLSDESFRFERPLAWVLGAGALLVLLARGLLAPARTPRVQVSRGQALATLKRGRRVWLAAFVTGLRVTAVLLLAVALMGPQSIHARDSTEVEGIDIVLALDLSLSMQAADIKPDRFRATQQVVDDFISRRPNDRVGAVIFGRDAFTLLPLTTDHQALRTIVGELQTPNPQNMFIDGRGTAIGNAIGVGLNRLRKSKAKSKVIILATDGDSNSGNISPESAAEFASALGVKIYTILMGRTDDAPVQMGRDLFGRPIFDRGNFPIDPELLKRVSAQTGGQAFQVADREGLAKSFHSILDSLEKSQIEDAGRVYAELFAIFVTPGLLFLVLELLLSALVLRRWP